MRNQRSVRVSDDVMIRMRQQSRPIIQMICSISAVISLLSALVACANLSGPKLAVVGTDPVILVHRSTGSQEALLFGKLAYEAKSRCMRVNAADGGRQTATPVWPSGTRPVLVEGRRGVEVPGAGTFLEGDRVEAKGGGSTWRTNPPAGLVIPEGCLPDGEGTVMIFGEVSPAGTEGE
ncbi:hypothetical protein [Streptosporangium saharense]|uniref:hypothetical protein n=1 Tax=Streptosporangium saharense TaxID=1706840 RepID=UPI0033197010